MEDVTPRLPTCQLPLTPEWFPIDLPDSLPLPLEKPQAPLHIYREPSPPSGLLFSSNMTFWEPPSENDVPFLTRSELSSPVSRVVVTPELPSDTPIHRDQVCHTVIQKRTMETSLLQQPLPATPLCEIVKEGQLCHLRRHERAGVFVRSTVKFDKAFRHLSGLRDNLQHLVIGLKSIPIVLSVDLVTDDAVVSLLQSLPALLEVRLHGFTKLTKRSFDAALIHCTKLRVLAITGTRVPGPEPRKIVFSNGRPQPAGGMGSLSPDTLRSLLPADGPIRNVSFIGQYLQLVDLSFQNVDSMLARDVTALPGRYGDLVVLRELQSTTERYAKGVIEVSMAVDGSKTQGLQRPIHPVASTVGWPAN